MKAFSCCLRILLVVMLFSVQIFAMNYNNALIQAVFNDNLQEVIRILATETIDSNYQDNYENYNPTALHIAAAGDNDVIVQLLLEAGASVHAKNHWGQTPLHAFAIGTRLHKPSKNMLELLVKAGADIHAQDNNGMTPLHAASYYFNKKAAALLLKLSNINIFMCDKGNRIALDVAQEHSTFYPDERERKQKMVNFLIAAYVDYVMNNRKYVTQEQLRQLPADLQEELQGLL